MSTAVQRSGRRPSIRQQVDLGCHLVLRQFRLRYSRSIIGWVWSVIQPLARLAVFTFTFKIILKSKVDNFPEFFFCSLLAWTLFSIGLMSATLSPVMQRELLVKPGFPRFMVPLIAVSVDALDYVITLPILLGFLALRGHWPAPAILTLPVFVLLELAFTVGIGYALAAANAYVRDVRLLVELALLLLFYVTPVFYEASSVPAKYRWIIDLNPVAKILESQRAVLLHGSLPPLGTVVSLVVTATVSLAFGLFVFGLASPNLADEV